MPQAKFIYHLSSINLCHQAISADKITAFSRHTQKKVQNYVFSLLLHLFPLYFFPLFLHHHVLPFHPNLYPSVPEGHPKVARRSPEGQPKIRRMSNAGESQVTRDHHVTILLLLYEARIRIIQETMKMNIFFEKNTLFLFNKQ